MTHKLRGLLALLLGFVLAGCGDVAPRDAPVKVVASIAPLADWARKVGGEHVSVEVIVPLGLNPRTYKPDPRQRDAIGNADVVLMNGLGLEPWIEDILEQAHSNRLIVLEMSQFTGPLTERVPRKQFVEPGQQGRLPRGSRADQVWGPAPVYSPYMWLDVGLAMAQVDLIARTLERADPPRIVDYRQNAARYTAELQNLNTWIFYQIDRWRWRSVLSTNRFLYPFAHHHQLPLLQWGAPVRRQGPPFPLVQPIFVDALAASEPLQARLSGRPVVSLNPLSEGDYLALMQHLVEDMTTAMTGS